MNVFRMLAKLELRDDRMPKKAEPKKRRRWDPSRCMNGPRATARRRRQIAKGMLQVTERP